MAKNYTFSEAVAIIAKGTDLEAITDIGRRYPVLAHKVAVVATKAGEAFVDLVGYMPDYLTANKVNTAIKAGIAESGSDTDEDAEETETATEETTEDTAEAKWDESMSAKQLWDILGKAGKRKLAKSTKKADLVEACKKAFGETAEAEDAEVEDEAEETETNAYEGKSAMELFKECKKRGIKAAAKKPAKFYADLLAKDDAANTEDAAEESDDDWGDDEEVEASKEEKKPAKKADKKASKKAEVEEDDDWDI